MKILFNEVLLLQKLQFYIRTERDIKHNKNKKKVLTKGRWLEVKVIVQQEIKIIKIIKKS